MDKPLPPLEIQLYFAQGQTAYFVQDDPVAARALLDTLPPPERLFAQPQFTIAGDRSLSLFPTAHITRLDISADDLPVWPFLQEAESVEDIDEETFQHRFDPEEYALARRRAWEQPGAQQTGFTELELTDGQHLFWEVQMASRPLLKVDVGQIGKPLLASGGLHARRPDGGYMIVNPAHILRLTFSPGPPQVSARAWPLRRA